MHASLVLKGKRLFSEVNHVKRDNEYCGVGWWVCRHHGGFAHCWQNEAADALAERLRELDGTSFRVVVVGGGATGVETAAEIKANHPQSDVSLVTQGEAASFKGPKIQKHMLAALTEQSIHVFDEQRVTAVSSNAVITSSQQFAADVIVWAGGFVASPLAKEARVQVNGRHQIMTDPFLRALSHPNIYAVGDMAFPVEEPGASMRMSLFTALVSGAHAADNIVAEIKGKSQKPLSFAWYGQGIAIGPNQKNCGRLYCRICHQTFA